MNISLFFSLRGSYILYAEPLQKLYYARIIYMILWFLIPIPFILLRNSIIFYIYTTLYIGCLAFKAYDYFVPFRYVAPDFDGELPDHDYSYATSGNEDDIDFWISNPPLPLSMEDGLFALVYLTPLILALVYRRFYPLWSTGALTSPEVSSTMKER